MDFTRVEGCCVNPSSLTQPIERHVSRMVGYPFLPFSTDSRAGEANIHLCPLRPAHLTRTKLSCCHSSATERRRKEPDSPWFQSWLPSPPRGCDWESGTSGVRLQKRPRPRWSRVVTHPHREPSRDGQALP